MKRNETVLVYGATALLLVILGVAVLFGNDGNAANAPATGNEKRTAQRLEELLLPQPEAGKSDPARPDGGATNGTDASGAKSEVPGNAAPTQGPPAPATVQPVALSRRDAVKAAGISALGESLRDGDFRLVTVKTGDDLSSLVARWCGSSQRETLDLVRQLNETVEVNRIAPGQRLVLPWVEDAILLDQHIARLEDEDLRKTTKETGTPHAATTKESVTETKTPAVGHKTDEHYLVKEKESLWAIASRQVEKKQVPAYIERIIAANPGLVPEKLKVGQKIRLP